MINKKTLILIALLATSVGINIYQYFYFPNKTDSDTPKNNKPIYKLIDPINQPIIDSNIDNQTIILHFNELKPQVESEIEKYNEKSHTGIFLQDIKTGAWLGINEREGFFPASLLKVPIMLAILKKVDRNEITLEDTIILEESDIDQNAGDLYEIGVGAELTVWDLIKAMILSSDNTAKNALKRQLTEAELNAVFTHVGIPNPYLPENDQTVTPRGYTRLLKSIYYASFLSPELSEKAMDIMTDTEMENLISARIPSEVQVAHKFSERPDGLGDCGIIYHPKNPYLICILTKEMEVPKAKALISSLSEIVYNYVSSQ